MFTFNLKKDFAQVERAFNRLERQQMPWARALALTRLAEGVRNVEQAEMLATFDTPTPFTLNSVTITPATKAKPAAFVYVKAIAETYLEPYVTGGNRSLGSKQQMLVPKGVRTNQYGNLKRNQLAELHANPNVFFGVVRTKNGPIYGAWLRPPALARVKAGKGSRGRGRLAVKARTPLKLLVEFEDTTPVPRRLPFFEVAGRYIQANAKREFEAAMRQAIATARKK